MKALKALGTPKIVRHFAVFLVLALAGSPSLSAPADGQALFEKRCSACHAQPDIHNPPSEGWEQRLESMAPLAKLKTPQKEAVLGYLLSAHSEEMSTTASLSEDQALFEEKCTRCHTLNRILLEPLTGESMRHVVENMQTKSGTDWLSDEDVERILNYLEKATLDVPKPPQLAAGASAEEIFAARCQSCHSLASISVHLAPDHAMTMDWSHVVARMRGKAPQWMSDAEAAEIVDYLQSLSDSDH